MQMEETDCCETGDESGFLGGIMSAFENAHQVAQAQAQAALDAVMDPETSNTAQPGLLAWGQYLACDVVIYRDDPFKSRKARRTVTQLALHESVTCDEDVLEDEPGERNDTTERVLRRRGLGVHLMIGSTEDGKTAIVVQHNDLRDVLYHTGRPVNDLSIGVEVVNPYYPSHKGDGPWQTVIDAPWAHKGKYVLALPCQCEALWQIYEALRQIAPGTKAARRINLTGRHWGESQKGNFALSPKKASLKRNTPGILAHYHYGHHADGAFPALYCAIRDRGYEPEEAYSLSVKLATGARGKVALPPMAFDPETGEVLR